ncbi:hypothetical protein EJ04DRAFT_563724 [Polyplosphaeria fusca]|uniref:DUF7626 domain-containing protein n=1 Tax=Polyplosphaeria fusca TaxID=682080 RepID=A0A9P4QYB7_9PLEO|nr:hypothetical protein EJ04DRAFT_563724 [Polyplosphaeria fusca]
MADTGSIPPDSSTPDRMATGLSGISLDGNSSTNAPAPIVPNKIDNNNDEMTFGDGVQVGDIHRSDDEEDEMELEGYKEYRGDAEDEDDDDMSVVGVAPFTQPAFFDRSTRHAERSSIRSQFNESNSFLLIEEPGRTRLSTRVPGTFGRQGRGKGDTLAAYARKVTADLDSDDELMMELRETGYSDQQIADQLASEGRVRYDRKSISTRITRIKLKQGELVDQMLAEGYLEWQYEDDKHLMEAYERANIEIQGQIEKLKSQRFVKVAEHMRRLDKFSMFSAHACGQRYQKLLNGTAAIPSDITDDPEARRKKLLAARTKFLEVRMEEQAAKEEEQGQLKQLQQEARRRQAEKAAQIAAVREEKIKERAEKMMQRAAQQQVRLARAQQNTLQKQARDAALKAVPSTPSPLSASLLADLPDYKRITPMTPDPRSYLSAADLKKLCAARALKDNAKSKQDLVDRLKIADDQFKIADLKAKAKAKGLVTSCSKTQLIYQLAMAEARQYASFAKGVGDARRGVVAGEDGMDDLEGAEGGGAGFGDGDEGILD